MTKTKKKAKRDEHDQRAEKKVGSVPEIGRACRALLDLLDQGGQELIARALTGQKGYDDEGKPGVVTKKGARGLIQWLLLELQSTQSPDMRGVVVADLASEYRWQASES